MRKPSTCASLRRDSSLAGRCPDIELRGPHGLTVRMEMIPNNLQPLTLDEFSPGYRVGNEGQLDIVGASTCELNFPKSRQQRIHGFSRHDLDRVKSSLSYHCGCQGWPRLVVVLAREAFADDDDESDNGGRDDNGLWAKHDSVSISFSLLVGQSRCKVQIN
jgi:hypothetical protein